MSSAHPSSAVRARGPAPSNVDLVAQALREAIVKGRLAPGDRIKEVPLSEQLGVSRGPIRDAIRQLEHDGLVTLIPNRGAVVSAIGSIDVLEVYALRASLGSLALHKLMLDGSALPVAELERARQRLHRAVKRRSGPRAADADLQYQSTVVASAGLPRVARQFDHLTWNVRIFIATLHVSYEDKLPQMLSEVTAIHRAILDRDVAAAERLWREKFERWVRDFAHELDEAFDLELWVALTSSARPPRDARG